MPSGVTATEKDPSGTSIPRPVRRTTSHDGEWSHAGGASARAPKTASPSARASRRDGAPSRLDARADGDAVFGALADAPPAWLHSPSWDVVRLTGRGIDVPLGSFSVAVTPDGTMFFVR